MCVLFEITNVFLLLIHTLRFKFSHQLVVDLNNRYRQARIMEPPFRWIDLTVMVKVVFLLLIIHLEVFLNNR